MQLIPIKDTADVNLALIALRKVLLKALEGNKKFSYRFDTVDVDDQPQGIKFTLEITPNVSLLKAEEMLTKLNKEIGNDKGKV